jgi:hypothetical protein
MAKNKTSKKWGNYLVVALVAVFSSWLYDSFFTPKNSLELYQKMAFADDYEVVQKLALDGYEGNIREEDFNYIKGRFASGVSQFTLFEYKEKSYVIMTSPGTKKLNVLTVEELPEDIRDFFLEFGQ